MSYKRKKDRQEVEEALQLAAKAEEDADEKDKLLHQEQNKLYEQENAANADGEKA